MHRPLLTALVACVTLAMPLAAQKGARADAMKAMEEGKFRLYEDHDASAARVQFNLAIRLDTTFNAPRFNLGVLSQAEGKWDEAVYWFTEFLHHDRTSRFASIARTEVARSRAMLAQGGPSREDEYLAAIELGKRLVSVNNARGALAEAQRAALLSPDRWESYALAAAAALRARDTVAASSFAARAVERGAPPSITTIVANMWKAGTPEASVAAMMMADSISREKVLERIRAEARAAPPATPPEEEQLSAVGYQLEDRRSAVGCRLSALGSRLSAVGSRLSALGSRLSAVG